MNELEELRRRVEDIERVMGRTGLHQTPHYLPANLRLFIADKDGDGDLDAYTSTSWDGDSFSDGTGTIDWVSDFGLPEKPRLVSLLVQVRDSDSANGNYYFSLKAKSTTTSESFLCRCPRAASDVWAVYHGCVPVAQNGTSYYIIDASGASTMDIYMRVVDWAR